MGDEWAGPGSDKWDQLHVPICLSTRGLFARVEVRDFDR